MKKIENKRKKLTIKEILELGKRQNEIKQAKKIIIKDNEKKGDRK